MINYNNVLGGIPAEFPRLMKEFDNNCRELGEYFGGIIGEFCPAGVDRTEWESSLKLDLLQYLDRDDPSVSVPLVRGWLENHCPDIMGWVPDKQEFVEGVESVI